LNAVRQLAKNVISKSLYSIFLRGISIAYSIYVIRTLSKAEYGLLALILTIVGIVNLLTNVGFPTMVMKSISKHYRHDIGKATSYFKFSLRMYSIITLVGAIVLFVFSPYLAQFYKQPNAVYLLRLGCLLFIGLSIFGLYETAFVAMNKYRRYLFQVAIPKEIILLVGGSILVYLGYGPSGVLSAQIGSVFIGLLISVFLAHRYLKGSSTSIDKRWIVKGALEITPGSWASGIALNLDILIMGIFVVLPILAAYKVSFNLLDMVVAFFPVAAFTLPTFHNQTHQEATLLLNRIIKFTLLFFTPVIFFFFSFSKEILVTLFGTKYAADYWILSILAFMIVQRILASVFVTALLYLGKFKTQSTIWVCAAALNAALMYFLVRSFGLTGALTTVFIIGYSLLFTMGFCICRSGMKIDLNSILKILILTSPLLSNFANLWIEPFFLRLTIFISSGLLYLLILSVKNVFRVRQAFRTGIALFRRQTEDVIY